MEGDQQIMVSSFLEIAVGQTADTARQFLQVCDDTEDGSKINTYYKLETVPVTLVIDPVTGQKMRSWRGMIQPEELLQDLLEFMDGSPRDHHFTLSQKRKRENSQAPPSKIQATQDHARAVAGNGKSEEDKDTQLAQASSIETTVADSFAKEAAKIQNRWLLVNLQSTREFSSHMLNRDTWANEAVAQTISSNFIFWQVCDDTEDGSKINTYYKLETVPVTLVIDPVTGQKMRSWRGMIQPEELLQDLLEFMDGSPRDHHFTLSQKRKRENSQAPPSKIQATQDHARAVARNGKSEEDKDTQLAQASSIETTVADSFVKPSKDMDAVNTENEIPKSEKITYPPLPEEPKGDRSLLCRVGVRLPDGRRLQRNFLRSDPIQLLWSFCCVNLEGSDEKPFRLTNAIPGAVKVLDYESKSTFDESGLSNSMISVAWE
ncbi:UBX domain-containing protein [Artemisia annua]|uniref:UBX domain-containing protein n=1 Tax=Artemisia annua TaxID=35608 RepID=A0A2U1N048_ARTAN|nr:UBX domain-containing protein [Artemisia annua]